MLALLTFGYLPIGKLLLVPLENRFASWKPAEGEPAGIIVLGGGIDPEMSAAHGSPSLSAGGTRIVVAAALARQYPNARLVYAGGNANLINHEMSEADAAAAVLQSLGVDRDRLRIERQSRNTQENVEFAKSIANPQPQECMASGDLGVPHATLDRDLSQGRFCGATLSGGLEDAGLVRRARP